MKQILRNVYINLFIFRIKNGEKRTIKTCTQSTKKNFWLFFCEQTISLILLPFIRTFFYR